MRNPGYNLKTDIGETTEAAERHPEIVAQMERILREQHRPLEEFPFPVLDRLIAK